MDAGRARLFLEQVLRRLGEDPGEYRLKVAREDWERGSRRLSLMRRDRRGFELFLRAIAVEDGECGVCIEGEFWLRDMTGEWPHVKPKRKVLMRATHQACVRDFLRAAEDYRNTDKEWVEEEVRERWAKFFEELASGFDPFAYRWRITIWRDECYVELEPILSGLPSRSYILEIPGEETVEMKLYFDEGWTAGRLFRRDAGTGQCTVEIVASGKERLEPTTDARKGNAPSD